MLHKYKYETDLSLEPNPSTGQSSDAYAQEFGWSLDADIDYHEYRLINDISQDRGERIEAFMDRAVKRELRRHRWRIAWNHLKSLFR